MDGRRHVRTALGLVALMLAPLLSSAGELDATGDGLIAWIEGPGDDGETHRVEFRFARTDP